MAVRGAMPRASGWGDGSGRDVVGRPAQSAGQRKDLRTSVVAWRSAGSRRKPVATKSVTPMSTSRWTPARTSLLGPEEGDVGGPSAPSRSSIAR